MSIMIMLYLCIMFLQIPLCNNVNVLACLRHYGFSRFGFFFLNAVNNIFSSCCFFFPRVMDLFGTYKRGNKLRKKMLHFPK